MFRCTYTVLYHLSLLNFPCCLHYAAHDYRKACLRHALTYFCILPAKNNGQPSTQKLQLPAPTPPISGESKPGSESVEDMEVIDCPDQVNEGAEMEEGTRKHSQVKRGGVRDEGVQTAKGGKVDGGLVDPVPQQGSPGPKLSFAEYRKCVTENCPACCTFCKQDGHRPEGSSTTHLLSHEVCLFVCEYTANTCVCACVRVCVCVCVCAA